MTDSHSVSRDGTGRSDDTVFETISYSVDSDGIATLVLDRPDVLNAFSVTMARELLEFFEVYAPRDEIRAVVVTGAGRAFCAGMDLAGQDGHENVFGLDESLEPTAEQFAAHFDEQPYQDGVRDTGGKITLAIYALRKPVIAAINGPAVGIGATMTLAMDTRLASTKARIGFVFGRLGVVPEACSSWFLPRIVGPAQALEWVYSADILTAQQALDGRLLRSVHEPEDLVAAAQALARSWTVGRSAAAIGLARELIYRGMGFSGPLQAHLADSLAMYYTSIGDGKEGVAAFNDKRDAVFSARASKLPRIIAD